MASNQDNTQDAELRQSRLTAFALGQLDDEQAGQVELELKNDADARGTVEEVRQFSQALKRATDQDQLPSPATELREAIMKRLNSDKSVTPAKASSAESGSRSRAWLALVVAVCLLIVAVPVANMVMNQDEEEDIVTASIESDDDDGEMSRPSQGQPGEGEEGRGRYDNTKKHETTVQLSTFDSEQLMTTPEDENVQTYGGMPVPSRQSNEATPRNETVPDYAHLAAPAAEALVDPSTGPPATGAAPQMAVDAYGVSPKPAAATEFASSADGRFDSYGGDGAPAGEGESFGTEQYDQIIENPFLPVDEQHARSTFSIDVDTASYANVRRFLTRNTLPPPNAVRIEEMINYFSYDYPQPMGDIPFSVNMEVAECPWKPDNRLLRIGLKGLEIDRDERPPSNIVFLLDTSGSMRSRDKLPLLQQAMKMLVRELTENDMITIVTYAGNAGLRLDATPGDQQDVINETIDSLNAGGSTHGSAGIMLAYEKAVENFIDEGTNRVILATDGDLNVGITRDDALVNLIKEKAQSGVFLTVLGFGTGNLKDSKMEKLADNGNGVYAYIDGAREARKVLVEQIVGSLVTIAKDVKIQIEFNPAEVQSYRLIGYENRLLAREDFDDDTKDAGEIGAGHTVTALYELVPAGADVKEERGMGELKYQKADKPEAADPEDLTEAASTGELLTLWLRYKQPDGDKSRKLEFALKDGGQKFNRTSQDFQFAASVAAFGMLLRGSEHRGNMSFSAIEEIASSAVGKDLKGYRNEFVDLVRKASLLGR